MIITIHQPAYLPWLGLLHKIALSDIYVFLDNVQFGKNSFTNRNKIKINKEAVWLTIPILLKNHLKKRIKEIEIDNFMDWRKKHWKSILLNYKKAPYFDKYSDFFEDIYKREWNFIADLDEYMLKWFLKELGVKTKFVRASEMDCKGSKSNLILNICEQLKADLYVSGAFGADYMKKEKFNEQGIKVYFQDYKHPVYPQADHNFLSYLGIIDLMFNCGDKSLEILMNNNITKQDLIKKFKL